MAAVVVVSSETQVLLNVLNDSVPLQLSGVLPVRRNGGPVPIAMSWNGFSTITLDYADHLAAPYALELVANSPQVRSQWGQFIGPLFVNVTQIPFPYPGPPAPQAWTATTDGATTVTIHGGTGGNTIGLQGIPPFTHVETGNTPIAATESGGDITLFYAAVVAAGDSISLVADYVGAIVITTALRMAGTTQIVT
jgi:hypothetical protein